MRRRPSPPFAQHRATAAGMVRRTSVAARRCSYLRMSRQPTSRVISISRWLSHPPQRVILFEHEDGRPSASRVGDDGSQAGCACVELAAVATSGVVDRRRHSGLAHCSSDGAFARRALLLRVHSVLPAQQRGRAWLDTCRLGCRRGQPRRPTDSPDPSSRRRRYAHRSTGDTHSGVRDHHAGTVASRRDRSRMPTWVVCLSRL